jgi:hypothetical protein
MSRIRTGHRPDDWREIGPAAVPFPQHPSGQLIESESGSWERGRQAKTERRARDAALLREALAKVQA